MSKYEKYLAEANAMLAEGFATKAAQKSALNRVSRAYEELREQIQRRYLDTPKNEATEVMTDLYYDMPYSSPSQWRPKHDKLLADSGLEQPGDREKIAALIAKYAEIKAAPIVPAGSKKDPLTLRAEELEAEFTAKAQADKTYEPSKDLEKQVRLPVGATQHYATSVKGNTFLRWKYYLSGRVTALRTILGVAEMKQLELDGKTEQAAVYRAAFEKTDPWAVHVADRANSPVTQAVRAVSEADTIEGVIDSMTRGSKP